MLKGLAMSKYDADIFQWTREQADALRRRASNEIDWDNVAEEIESMGRSDRREVGARLEVILVHLLKWRYQPDLRCTRWRGSIDEARQRIEDLFEESPSLVALPIEQLPKAYERARKRALRETGLLRLPDICPWTVDEILAEDFLPQ
jgi:hypothetical protein